MSGPVCLRCLGEFSGGGWLGPSIHASITGFVAAGLVCSTGWNRIRPLQLGGWVGIGLGIVALLFHLAITRTATNPITLELPLLPLLEVLGPWIKQAYAVILWGELFTTYIANVYGIVQRWGESRGLSYENRLLLVILATVAISRAGFARMIRIFYPLFGGFSLLLLLCLVLKRIVEKYGVNQ